MFLNTKTIFNFKYIFCLFLIITPLFTILFAQSHPIQVGTAKIDITPKEAIRLTGYADRLTESEGVAQKIWARAIAFGSDEQEPTLLITVDLLGVAAYWGEQLADSLAKKTVITRKQIALSATHTHCAPATGGVASLIFADIPPEEMGRVADYTAEVLDKLEEVALMALKNRQAAYVSWSKGKVDFATNRRVEKEGKFDFGANYEGAVDHDLPLMRITDVAGNILALVVNYACHCTTLKGDFNQLHGDWAGVAREKMEANHPNAMGMITIGCGADADPQPRGKMEHVVQHGNAIAKEVERLLKQPMKSIIHPPKAQLETVALPFAHVPDHAELLQRGTASNWQDIYAKQNLLLLSGGGQIPEHINYPIQTWTFGNELTMVFLGGEVVVDYALRLKRELGGDRLWINAYSNDVPCYIASERILKEGGYEAETSMYYYNKPSPFLPGLENKIIGKVKELVTKNWYKGNLHTHSYWSDGDEFPEVIMDWYKSNGYHFVGLSDHNILAKGKFWKDIPSKKLHRKGFQNYLKKYGEDWVVYKEENGKTSVKLKTLAEYQPLFEEKDHFLILPSEEITDKFEDKHVHLNATNIQHLIEPQGGTSIVDVLQNNINAVIQQRRETGVPMMVHINHPNFHYSVSLEDMIQLRGERFFEVFNGHHAVHNFGDSLHIGTEEMWDLINIAYLTKGQPLIYGLATDDSHHYHETSSQLANTGRGWVAVQANKLTASSLITAMEQGQFYASAGVNLTKVDYYNNELQITVDEEPNVNYTITFIGCQKGERQTKVLKTVNGTQASFKLNKNHLFVRAKVVSNKAPDNPIENMENEVAWTQPVLFR